MNIENDGGGEGGIRPAEALETELVLVNIFSRLPSKDLMSSRLVCRLWHRLSTPELQKQMGRLFVSDLPEVHRRFDSTKSRFKHIDSFLTFCKTRGASESTLNKIQFTNICFNFYPEKNVINLDWIPQIKSLELLGLASTQVNQCILTLFQRMTQLTHLRLSMFRPGDRRIKGPESVAKFQNDVPPDFAHGLEALEIKANSEELESIDTAFLKKCKKLEALSFEIEGATSKWRKAFMDPEHNHGIKFLKLKWWSGSGSLGLDETGFLFRLEEEEHAEAEYAKIAELINSYPKLENLHLDIRDLSRSRCWDAVYVLPDIRISSIKTLSLGIMVLIVRGDGIDLNEATDWFYFLRQPQFKALEHLKIGLSTWFGFYGSDYNNHEPHELLVQGAYFLLPCIKSFVVKFCCDWRHDNRNCHIQVLTKEMLRTAAARMPGLESIHLDVSKQFENFEAVVQIAGCFTNLKDLTVCFLRCGGIPEDSLFGNWESNTAGLLALTGLRNLTMLLPEETIKSAKVFQDVFAKMAGLRVLKINKTGCKEEATVEVIGLDLGQVSLQWISEAETQKLNWKEMVRAPIPEAK